MTEPQVSFYSKNLSRVTKNGLVSENRRMSNPFNEELQDLKKLLSRDFIVKNIDLPPSQNSYKGVLERTKKLLKAMLGRTPLNEYERWFCRPRN